MTPLPDHQYAARTLLALLAGTEVPGKLDDAHWRQLKTLAQRHRLIPMLRRRLRERPEVEVPDHLADALERGKRRATMIALKRQRDLVLVFRCLNAGGITAVVQKGAYLAFNAYPHPSLRPMRDLDAEFLDRLAPLLLSDSRQGREGRLSKESGTGATASTTAALVLRRLFAPPGKVATLFTVPADTDTRSRPAEILFDEATALPISQPTRRQVYGSRRGVWPPPPGSKISIAKTLETGQHPPCVSTTPQTTRSRLGPIHRVFCYGAAPTHAFSPLIRSHSAHHGKAHRAEE